MPHILIVTSPYYEDVAKLLMNGTQTALNDASATFDIIEASGALEIPLAIKLGMESGKYDGALALGCVIRGETSHYDIVCNESARGITNLALENNFPIGNAILTCDTMEQAVQRADPREKNKGADAVSAVLGLIKIKKQFQK